jgi:hypothetical protein
LCLGDGFRERESVRPDVEQLGPGLPSLDATIPTKTSAAVFRRLRTDNGYPEVIPRHKSRCGACMDARRGGIGASEKNMLQLRQTRISLPPPGVVGDEILVTGTTPGHGRTLE